MMIQPLARSAPCRHKGTRLTKHIQSLIANLERPVSLERRHYDRIAVPFLLRLTPLGAEGQPLPELATTVVGKDLSPRGLSFFHQNSLPYRRAVILLEHPELDRLTIEVEICWCRFSKLGWYESGGRLIHVIDQVPTAPVGGLPQSNLPSGTAASAAT